MTITEKLTHLLKIEAEATRGPWKGEWVVFVYGEGHSPVCRAESSDDRRLITASRNALRPLVTALEAAIELLHHIERYGEPEDSGNAQGTLARIESILAEIP